MMTAKENGAGVQSAPSHWKNSDNKDFTVITSETQAISPGREMAAGEAKAKRPIPPEIKRFRDQILDFDEFMDLTANSDKFNGCLNVDAGWRMPPPAQMFADVKWDREAGAWRFIEPLDDPQHHRHAVAIGAVAAAVARKAETVPLTVVDRADDLSTVCLINGTTSLAVFVTDNPFTIAAAKAFVDGVEARRVSARMIVVGG